jgi:hypothetical protein
MYSIVFFQRTWQRRRRSGRRPKFRPQVRSQDSPGTACQSPAMANGRCRMHGGASTGPRTADGLERSRRARWKHGLYSAEALAEQKRVRELLAQGRELLKQMQVGRTHGFTVYAGYPRSCPTLAYDPGSLIFAKRKTRSDGCRRAWSMSVMSISQHLSQRVRDLLHLITN